MRDSPYLNRFISSDPIVPDYFDSRGIDYGWGLDVLTFGISYNPPPNEIRRSNSVIRFGGLEDWRMGCCCINPPTFQGNYQF